MADEITNQPSSNDDVTVPQKELSGKNRRIMELSEKVELTAKERDEKTALIEERDKEIATLKKENEFNTGFAEVLGTHAAAKDHRDEIKAKVLAGYTVEDATFAVLGKAGKLGGEPAAPPENPAGGSATTTPPSEPKSIGDMTQEERRAVLEKELIFS